MARVSLADALFTTTQQRVLGALYGQPQRSFTVSELIASTGSGSGAVQRELAKLTASGLLTMRPIGNQKHYQANPAAPIHDELAGIIQKTVGLAEPLRSALAPLAHKIVAAFVFGSIARGEAGPRSDVDLMVVGDATFADVVEAVYPLHERLGREVNPVVMTIKEFRKRAKDPGFIARVRAARASCCSEPTMTLENLARICRLQPHAATREEIRKLLAGATRSLNDKHVRSRLKHNE